MPELPEVETVRASLAQRVVGMAVNNIFWSGKNMRHVVCHDGREKTLQQYWRGQKILGITRRAKYIIITGHGAQTSARALLCHLGMSGFFRFMRHNDEEFGVIKNLLGDEKKLKHYMVAKHLHVLLVLNGGLLAFYDPRRFGFVADVASNDLPHHPSLATLGVEPDAATVNDLWPALQKHNLPLKTFLLNQKIIVGIGNIYAAEILWLAGISPQKNCRKVTRAAAEQLLSAIKSVLQAAIEKGGSSFSDFQNIDGELGYFANQWRAYGMAGKPCQQCGGTIKKFLQHGRTTYHCPAHQK